MAQFNPQFLVQPEGIIQKQRNFTFFLACLGIAVLVSMLLAVCLGSAKIAPGDAYRIILAKAFNLPLNDFAGPVSQAHLDIIWQIRLPRVLMSAVVGAGLAVCGAVMQAAVQNPLAEPYLLGISAGASLGATFSILIGGLAGVLFGLGTAVWAFIGALAASLFVMTLSGIGGRASPVKMILAGSIASALFIALANFIVYLSSNAEGMRSVAFWTMGSLAAAKWDNLALPAAGIAASCIFFLTQFRILNTLLLGEETAITLGIDLARVRQLYLVITALITGLIVAVCGIFGFVGLVVPHVARGVVGADHRRLLPAAILTGAIFLIWADVLARIVLTSGELPIGILTALVGAPFFMYILVKHSVHFGGQ